MTGALVVEMSQISGCFEWNILCSFQESDIRVKGDYLIVVRIDYNCQLLDKVNIDLHQNIKFYQP